MKSSGEYLKLNQQIIWVLGAHDGKCLKFLDGHEVYALEPNPNLFLSLKKHCPEQRLLNKALVGGGREETIKFYYSREISEWGTTETSRLLSGLKFTTFEEVMVESVKLQDLMKIWPTPNIILVDIEGSELNALVEPMMLLKDYFTKSIIIIELSKDNWESIFKSFSLYRNQFSIVINGKIDRTNQEHSGATSSIEEWISEALLKSNIHKMDASSTKKWLEIWFEGKNRNFEFNFSAWVDLVIYS